MALTSACSSSSGDKIRTLKAGDFFDLLARRQADGGAVILDVRTPEEFQAGHAPGALNINFYDSDFSASLDRLDKNQSYFVYCRSGSRSGKTLTLMKQNGFTEVYDLAGGWMQNAALLSEL